MDPDSMLAALQASGPDPTLADQLLLFGQFVGAWDVAITNIAPECLTRWIFSQITPQRFYWRNVVSNDNGATCTTVQTMVAQRTLT